MLLINRRTEEPIATAVAIATTRRERRRGLLGRNSMESEEALILTPCHAIHTIGMRFAIDVVFVDRDGRILRMVPEVAPWRTAWAAGAEAVIELATGCLRRAGALAGDALYLAPAPGDAAAASRSASSLRRTAAMPAWLGS